MTITHESPHEPAPPRGCPAAQPWALLDANDATGLGALREPQLVAAAFAACSIARPLAAPADVLLYNRRGFRV